MHQWWREVVETLLSPGWSAGLLQSFTGTAIALIGGLVIFRSQIRHDRSLAMQALEAADISRAAERQARAATTFGLALIAAVDDYAREDTKLPTVRTEIEAYHLKEQFPGSRMISTARAEAGLVLELDRAVGVLANQRQEIWDAVMSLERFYAPWSSEEECLKIATLCRDEWLTEERSARSRPGWIVYDSISEFEAKVEKHFLEAQHQLTRNHERWSTLIRGFALNELMAENNENFKTYARALCRWDGNGQPPGLDTLHFDARLDSDGYHRLQEYNRRCREMNKTNIKFNLRHDAWDASFELDKRKPWTPEGPET